MEPREAARNGAGLSGAAARVAGTAIALTASCFQADGEARTARAGGGVSLEAVRGPRKELARVATPGVTTASKRQSLSREVVRGRAVDRCGMPAALAHNGVQPVCAAVQAWYAVSGPRGAKQTRLQIFFKKEKKKKKKRHLAGNRQSGSGASTPFWQQQ